jgi:hypothetical protein
VQADPSRRKIPEKEVNPFFSPDPAGFEGKNLTTFRITAPPDSKKIRIRKNSEGKAECP